MFRTVPVFIMLFCLAFKGGAAQGNEERTAFYPSPSPSASPWVYWYWINGGVSRAGIKADLEAMKEAGIGGAYLMDIKMGSKVDPDLIKKLNSNWWGLVRYAMGIADSLDIKLGINACDGWATASGPWITPERSMQKVVWSQTQVKGGRLFDDTLRQPEAYKGYYKDIAVFAFPALPGSGISTRTVSPVVTTSTGAGAGFLVKENNEKNFVSKEKCWIQYQFEQPFTCRSLKIRVRGKDFQAYRLLIQASNDGKTFHTVQRLKPARSGWQDYAIPEATYAIPPVTARYFRFVYDPAGTEPGSEDLDAAKWPPVLKLCGITLYSQPQINQFEGKNGIAWRVSDWTTEEKIPDSLCVGKDQVIDITRYLDSTGRLKWKVPVGDWTILRMGHTSTGRLNSNGGIAQGLECDKFNPEAVKKQFEGWFGQFFNEIDSNLAGKVIKIFHVDSWECGSQNWSPVFRKAFIKYRGYDPLPYLPIMAGIPVQSPLHAERFLYDVRYTIAHLLKDNFFGTLENLAHEKGCQFSAESVAPTMVSNGMLHFSKVDIPMGEFWLRSPTHDKPNDILDAVSGAHIYGKQIVQAESFTEIREMWDEHPGMLKTLLDRNYALGINRAVYHVFCENPWTDQQPGMTLGGIGLYFQRDQTWWKPGKAWVQYAARCQELLQQGKPVTDIAVFTGWEIPRRSMLPDRLVSSLPGIFGKTVINREKKRLANVDEPVYESPSGLKYSANIYDPLDWIDPLHGYAYDCINEDALIRLAHVEDGRIVLPGGASYGLLVIPAAHQMQPEGNKMRASVAKKLLELVEAGATLLLCDRPRLVPGLDAFKQKDSVVQHVADKLLNGKFERIKMGSGYGLVRKVGKGKVLKGPFLGNSFKKVGLQPDLVVQSSLGQHAEKVAWTHRVEKDSDIYFIANQLDTLRTVNLSVRASGRIPEFYDAVTGEHWQAKDWEVVDGRTEMPVRLEPNRSLFVLFRQKTDKTSVHEGENWMQTQIARIFSGSWQVRFDPDFGGSEKPVVFKKLTDWTKSDVPGIRYYSGTAVYKKSFSWDPGQAGQKQVWLDLGKVDDLASVKVNGVDCGVAWTYPFRVNITAALKRGNNTVEISVTNTWANRLIGDHGVEERKRITRTTAPYYLGENGLRPSGLIGPVRIAIATN